MPAPNELTINLFIDVTDRRRTRIPMRACESGSRLTSGKVHLPGNMHTALLPAVAIYRRAVEAIALVSRVYARERALDAHSLRPLISQHTRARAPFRVSVLCRSWVSACGLFLQIKRWFRETSPGNTERIACISHSLGLNFGYLCFCGYFIVGDCGVGENGLKTSKWIFAS